MKKSFYALPLLILMLTCCTAEFDKFDAIPSPEELFGGISSSSGGNSSPSDGNSSSSGDGSCLAPSKMDELCGGEAFSSVQFAGVQQTIRSTKGRKGCYYVKNISFLNIATGAEWHLNGKIFQHNKEGSTQNNIDSTHFSSEDLPSFTSKIDDGYYIYFPNNMTAEGMQNWDSEWAKVKVTEGTPECLNREPFCTMPNGAIEGKPINYTLKCGTTTDVSPDSWSSVNLDNNLEPGTYNNVKVTATCGGISKEVSCYNSEGGDSIKIMGEPDSTCAGYANFATYCPNVDWFDIKWNTEPDKERVDESACYYVMGVTITNAEPEYKINGSIYSEWKEFGEGKLELPGKVDEGYYIYVPEGAWSKDFIGDVGVSKPTVCQ